VDDNVPMIHNIGVLLEQFESKLPISVEKYVYSFLYELSTYYIDNHYPDFKSKLSRMLNNEKVQGILLRSKEVFSWLLTLRV
jgi:HEPN domain-containing protein